MLDGDAFFAETERFVTTVEAWTRIVADYRAGSSSGPEAAAPAAAPDAAPLPGGFLQV